MRIKVHENNPIQERDISEMARVGYSGKNSLEISVWTNDGGEIPHVHVRNGEPLGKSTCINLCIQLEKAMYFTHGEYNGMLNASQRKDFNDFMHKPHKTGKFDSNYEYAVFLWNDNNSSHNIELKRDSDGKVIIPDYREIAIYAKD